jgi:hypothetical protein
MRRFGPGRLSEPGRRAKQRPPLRIVGAADRARGRPISKPTGEPGVEEPLLADGLNERTHGGHERVGARAQEQI